MSDLAGFVLDYCRALGAVVEPPAYGVYDVLLPDAVAAQLGVDAFQRWSFNAPGASDEATRLSYGHPLVERLVELALTDPACVRLYLNAVRLDKTGLLGLARAELAFANATLAAEPRAAETRALFHVVRFNFKAALVSDEKRERLVSVLLDAQTGAARPELSADEALRLESAPVFTALPTAPAQWHDAPDPLGPAALRALLERATQAAAESLEDQLAALRQRTARLLELDRARLEAYYVELESDLERRLKRAEDEARRATLADKLTATRADHAAKLADAEAKYRPRLELKLINLAVITQPKVILAARIENRQAAVTRNLVWDPLRHRLEPLTCDVCRQPAGKMFLCANQHLACERCLAPQCVDCRRVYCRHCSHEVTTCVVCGRAVCLKSVTRCRACGQGTCREHAGQCHAPRVVAPTIPAAVETPPTSTPKPARAIPPRAPRSKKAVAAGPQRPAEAASPATAYRLQVEVRADKALVVGFVLTPAGVEAAQRVWELTGDGILVACFCEKGQRCPSHERLIPPDPAARIEAQISAELDRLRSEYRIPPYRMAIFTEERGELIRLPRLQLRGQWKNPELVNAARTVRPVEAAQPLAHPKWVLAFAPADAKRFLADIDRFVRISYGWLVFEGALDANELAKLAAATAQPESWYTAERAQDLFKSDTHFRVLRGKIIAIAPVEHPLKVMQAKAARRLPARSFTAAELLAAADGLAPLTSREAEIEQALNRHAPRQLHLGSIQDLMRNTERPAELLASLISLCAPPDKPEAEALMAVLSELWNSTRRYELRGRTPNEVREMP